MGKFRKALVYILLFGLITIFQPKTYAVEQILDVILPISNFLDVPDNYWAITEIKELHQKGVLQGYPDHKFRPESPISREEFATVAIKALGLDDAEVLDPLEFDDFFENDWAWNYVQNAYYFGLLTPPRENKNGYYFFNPTDPILRAHAITIAVNALKTMPISKRKARATLEFAYDDFYKIPDWFAIPMAKAQLLDMLAIDPRKPKLINYDKPITRAETAVLIYNMMYQAIRNPNEKIKATITKKKTAQGHILQDAFMNDEIVTIPKGTIIPLVITGQLNSQKSCANEKFTALVPKNLITGSKYLLLPAGSKFNGHIRNIKKGRFLIRNAVLTVESDTLEVLHQPRIKITGIASLKPQKPDSRFRKIFKGEKLYIDRGEFLELELMQDLRIDVTTGKILQTPNL